ncbi:hypothetical protein ACN8C3_04647 (plasmid) [Escherichia coli HB101]|uniref:hypothetical protein n=1 Tax=Escherichia coli TaxID=562 RepID=UPI003B5963F4
MNRTFDRKAYRQELIDAGFSAEDAETIASRTVMRAPRETFQSVGSMVQQATAKIERDSVQLAPLPCPRHRPPWSVRVVSNRRRQVWRSR